MRITTKRQYKAIEEAVISLVGCSNDKDMKMLSKLTKMQARYLRDFDIGSIKDFSFSDYLLNRKKS